MTVMTLEVINRLNLNIISETKYNRHVWISYQTRLCLYGSCYVYFMQQLLKKEIM